MHYANTLKNILKYGLFMSQKQVFWYLKHHKKPRQLTQDIKVNAVIIGGGMAGISAAHHFRKKGLSVALIEKYFCGAGATGKSSGFITPNSELGLDYFTTTYGLATAQKIWELVTAGVHLIKKNINDFNIACQYQPQDVLVVALKPSHMTSLQKEYNVRKQLNYQSTLYNAEQLSTVIGTTHYAGGLHYNGSFSIDAYAYIQGMKNILEETGVAIYEETPALAIEAHTVKTPYATLQADYIIVCADRWIPDMGKLTHDIYHAQTFLMLSTPLRDEHVKKIFPQKPLLVWDTDLIYQYFRLTKDNRLLVGGGNLLYTYAQRPYYYAPWVYKKLTSYITHKFPDIPFNFAYQWPGLIGISKDLVPCAGRDRDFPHIYYIGGATGLPWAATLGHYSAENLLDNRTDFDTYFSPYRSYLINHTLQRFLGTPFTFAISNGINMLF